MIQKVQLKPQIKSLFLHFFLELLIQIYNSQLQNLFTRDSPAQRMASTKQSLDLFILGESVYLSKFKIMYIKPTGVSDDNAYND